LVGRIEANRSGHAQNRELIRRISGNDSGQHSEVNSRAA
jgi:hypothetical protein